MKYECNWICDCPEMWVMQHDERDCKKCGATAPHFKPVFSKDEFDTVHFLMHMGLKKSKISRETGIKYWKVIIYSKPNNRFYGENKF